MKTLLSLTSRKPLVRVVFQRHTPTESVIRSDKQSDVVSRAKKVLGQLSREIAFVMSLGIAHGSGAQELPKLPENPSIQVANIGSITQSEANTRVAESVKTDIDPITAVELESYTNPPRTPEAKDFLSQVPKELRSKVAGDKNIQAQQVSGTPENVLQIAAVNLAKEFYENLNKLNTQETLYTQEEINLAEQLSKALGKTVKPPELVKLKLDPKFEDEHTDLTIALLEYQEKHLDQGIIEADAKLAEADAKLQAAQQKGSQIVAEAQQKGSQIVAEADAKLAEADAKLAEADAKLRIAIERREKAKKDGQELLAAMALLTGTVRSHNQRNQ